MPSTNLIAGRHPRPRPRWLAPAAILVAVGIGLVGWLWWGFSAPAAAGTTPVAVTIESGIGVDGIATELKELGLIRSPLFFKAFVGLTGQRDALQAGAYQVTPGSSLGEIVAKLSGGEVQDDTVWVTLPEGLTSAEVIDRLVAAGLGQAAAYETIVAAGDLTAYSELVRDGKPRRASLEGYLFPDTYEFYRDTEPAVVIDTLVSTLESRLTPELREQVAASELTFFEILTLASIVEKEVGAPEDRAVVAGIFLKRLNDGMRLQSDATINYITKAGRTRPTAADLAAESPYNTYRNDGLPPGPIANPGIDAIAAVLNPTDTPYYFFLTTPAGDPVYAKTFEEHTANKAKYYP